MSQLTVGESGKLSVTAHLSIYCALFLIGILAFWPGLNAQYFGDDFQWYFGAAPHHALEFFLARNPLVTYAYRPLEACFLLTVQTLWGLNTVPIHLAQVALHSLMCWLILVWMRQLRFDWLQSLIGCGYMLISQANVHAVISNDTFSQISGTVSGYLSLWFLFLSLTFANRKHMPLLLRTLSIVAFVWALLSKETTTSFLLMAAVILCWWHLGASTWKVAIKRASLALIPYVVIVVVYLAIRAALDLKGPQLGTGRYDFHFGLNIPINLGLFLFQGFLPTSSSSTFIALKTGDKFGLGLALGGALMIAIFTGYGWLRLQRSRTLLALVLLGVLGLMPAIFINKVSELYLYNSMPIIAVLLGAGLGGLIKSQGRTVIRLLTITLLICLSVTNLWALRGKTTQMSENGERSTSLLHQISQYFGEIPAEGRLVLVNPKSAVPEYSVFSINGFNVLEDGRHRLNELASRTDFGVDIIKAEKAPAFDPNRWLILSLDPGSGVVTRLESPGPIGPPAPSLVVSGHPTKE